MIKARILVLAGALAFTAVVCAMTPMGTGNPGDGAFYAAMAGHPRINPNMARVGPWAYRVAVPALVKQLPLDTITSFRVVAFATTVATLFLMFLILEQFGFAASLCAAGVALYAGVFWAVRFACYAPAYIDAETQLMLLAIVYFTIRGWYAPLIVVMVAAALVKESLPAFLLFTIAALYRRHAGHVDARTSFLVGALVILPVVTIGVVRVLVTTVSALDTGSEVREQVRMLATPSYWAVLLHAVFSGLGLLPVVIALRPRRVMAVARERYEWIAYALLAIVLAFGGRDKGRLLLYALPAAVLFAVVAIDDLGILKRSSRGMAWLVILVVAHLYIGNYLTPIGTELEYLAKLAPEHNPNAHLPYLWRNLAIATGFAAVTWVLLRPTPMRAASADETARRPQGDSPR